MGAGTIAAAAATGDEAAAATTAVRSTLLLQWPVVFWAAMHLLVLVVLAVGEHAGLIGTTQFLSSLLAGIGFFACVLLAPLPYDWWQGRRSDPV